MRAIAMISMRAVLTLLPLLATVADGFCLLPRPIRFCPRFLPGARAATGIGGAWGMSCSGIARYMEQTQEHNS